MEKLNYEIWLKIEGAEPLLSEKEKTKRLAKSFWKQGSEKKSKETPKDQVKQAA
jgi:hypothetical protein